MPPQPPALPDTAITPYTPATRRLLSRLGKEQLLDLVLGKWLDPDNVAVYAPDLTPTEDDEEEEEELSIEGARGVYEGFRRKAVKGKEVVERVVEREWRGGLRVGMVAEMEWEYLVAHPTAHKWTASTLHVLNRSTNTEGPPPTPRFHAPTFTRALSTLLRPLASTHTFARRHPTLPLVLLRLALHPPHNAPAAKGKKNHLWLAFPADAPGYVYATEGMSDVVREAVAAAVSREHARFEVRPCALVARSLEACCYFKGGGGGEGGMVGVWSVYAEGLEGGPLDAMTTGPGKRPAAAVVEGDAMEGDAMEVDTLGGTAAKDKSKHRKIAEARFGTSAVPGDGRGLESVEFVVEDVFPPLMADGKEMRMEDEDDDDGRFRPSVGVRLEGAHVFAGVRACVEEGVAFDGVRMPGWLVGEAGVSWGRVKDGVVVKRRR